VTTKPQRALGAKKIRAPHLQPERACFTSAVLRNRHPNSILTRLSVIVKDIKETLPRVILSLATGGLIFTKSPDIEMRSEDLFISMKEIRVQYRFFNHSSHAVVTHVAFPVPDLPFGTGTDLAIPTNDPENILGFTTTVDNQPVAALVERKALLNGIDKTEVLQKLGVPLAPRSDQKSDHLSRETWNQLIRDGLIEDTPHDAGYINPLWTLKTTYYWEQRSPQVKNSPFPIAMRRA
jgi:Domain of unknown function (DUF4424)